MTDPKQRKNLLSWLDEAQKSGVRAVSGANLLRQLQGAQKIVHFALVSPFELVEQKANNEVKGQFSMPGKGSFVDAMLGDESRVV